MSFNGVIGDSVVIAGREEGHNRGSNTRIEAGEVAHPQTDTHKFCSYLFKPTRHGYFLHQTTLMESKFATSAKRSKSIDMLRNIDIQR